VHEWRIGGRHFEASACLFDFSENSSAVFWAIRQLSVVKKALFSMHETKGLAEKDFSVTNDNEGFFRRRIAVPCISRKVRNACIYED